jgi:hypothetical protein
VDESLEPDTPTAAPATSGPPPAEAPKPIDKALARRLIDRCIRDAEGNTARLQRDQQDWQNLLFERGGAEHQWSIWDPSTQTFVPRSTDPSKGGIPEYVPRPVINIFAKKVDGIAAILNQSEPAQQFAPETDDDEDRAAAEVAEDAVPVLRQECGYDRGDRSRLNRLAVLTNAAAYVVYYDNDPRHGTAPIDTFQCGACETTGITPLDIDEAGGECPACGAPEELLGLALDGQANPVQTDMPTGKVCGEVIPSFEFSVPRSARTLDSRRLPWVLLHSRMAPDEVARRWPSAAKAAADRSGYAFRSGTQRKYADAMRKLAAPISGKGQASADTEFDGPVVYRLFHDPIEDGDFQFPRGLYAVLINGELADATELPLKDDKDRAVKNVLIRQFAPSTVSAHGKPPADDMVPLQQQHNTLWALTTLILMHEAAPTTYIPDTVTLLDEPSGAPGESVRYRSLDGAKPERLRGMNPPEGLFKAIELTEAKFEEVSGLNSVLGGARPEGDPTLGEVQVLQERGMQTFREPLDSLIQFEEDLARILLWIGRQSAWSPRFRRIRGDNDQWEISQFTAADLDGHIDIQTERASAWPKSPLMQQLKLKDAVSMGVLMPQQDPELAAKLLKTMGLADLKPSLSVDLKQIARKLDRWKAAATPDAIAPPDPLVENVPLHLEFCRQFLRTEEVEELATVNPPVYQAMRGHVQQLEAHIAQQQAAAAAAQAQAAGTGPEPGQGGGGGLQQAIDAGLLQPAGAQPAAPPALEAALASGVLQPAGAAMPPAAPLPSIDDLIAERVLTPVPPAPPGAPRS